VRAASLEEVTRRCFAWRNVMAEVLHESAAGLGSSPEALVQALSILQLSLEFSLVRMCGSFEAERRKTDEELARREEELSFLATHDPLTGLPNRTLILDRAGQMLARSVRNQTPVAALFIDLDNFKSINDTLGHGVGDELLRAVTARLDGVIRDADALGRLGGDEFVVVSEALTLQVGPELIAERLLEALSNSDLDPAALTIEITETTLMRNVEDTARRLAAIKELGVKIAIDDFGTGYSSLAHLQRFPVDALKIDRSFISGLTHNEEGETLMHTLVQLGKALSIETFAEGIEQQQELSLLREQDCDSGQGYLFARPLDVSATEAFLQNWAENPTPALARTPQHA
jgi:diguanylate cyclase (GGDEF)-like protein